MATRRASSYQSRVKWGIALSLLSLGFASQQLRADAPTITGFIDTTYGYDLNKPISRTTAMRSFDRKTDTFLLNAAQVNFQGDKDGIGYYAELAFGTDPSVYKALGTGADAGLPAAPSATAYNFELQEAFVTYKCPKTAIMLKAGKFVTFEGIEVIESKDNFTISRGHLFGLAEPATHVGAMAGYAFPKVLDLWVGVVNGWDLHTDNNYGKTLVAKVGFAVNDKVSGLVSVLHGPEQANNTNNARTSFDTTWTIKPVSKVAVALQFNAGQEDKTSVHPDRLGALGHWYGFTVQPKVDVTDKLFVGARAEWFSDLDGARTGTTQVVKNITLCPGVNLSESLMLRFEYRYDWSTQRVYESNDAADPRFQTSTLASELIYKF